MQKYEDALEFIIEHEYVLAWEALELLAYIYKVDIREVKSDIENMLEYSNVYRR